jgi:hypothetical protein
MNFMDNEKFTTKNNSKDNATPNDNTHTNNTTTMDNTTPIANAKMDFLKRKQTHDETFPQDFNPPRAIGYANMDSSQTREEAQTDSFTSQEIERLRTRDEKHVEYEQSLTGALDTAKELIDHLTQSVEDKGYAVEQIKITNDQLSEANHNLSKDKRLLVAQVQEMHQKLQKANKSFKDCHADYEHEFELAEEAKKDQCEVIDMLAEEKRSLEAQARELQAKNNAFEKANDSLRADWVEEFQHLEEQKKDQREVIDALGKDRKLLEAQLHRTQREKNELEKENGALRLEIEHLSNVAEEFGRAQDAAHAENDRLKEELQRKADVVKGAFAQVESSKANLQEEMERNEASEQELRDTISDLNIEKSELEAQVRLLADSAGRAWDIVRDKQQLRRNETKDWQDDFDRQDEYVQELEKKVEKLEKDTSESRKKIDKLMDEKIDVFNVWREEVKDLKEKLQEGEEANTTLREQISVLEEEIQEMIAERVVSSDDEDENDDISNSASASTLRGSSPVYDVPGWTPSSIPDWIRDDQHEWGQSETESIDLDETALDSERSESNDSENNNSESDNSENDDWEDIGDIKYFLAHIARLYLNNLTAHQAFKLGKISGREHYQEEQILLASLEAFEKTRSRDRALEIWNATREGMRGIGDSDQQLHFLKETIRVMEAGGEEKSLEELLDVLPKATRKRSRREEDERVESWVQKAEKQCHPETKRRRVERGTEM